MNHLLQRFLYIGRWKNSRVKYSIKLKIYIWWKIFLFAYLKVAEDYPKREICLKKEIVNKIKEKRNYRKETCQKTAMFYGYKIISTCADCCTNISPFVGDKLMGNVHTAALIRSDTHKTKS